MLNRNIPPLFIHMKPIMHMIAATGDVEKTFNLYHKAVDEFFHQEHYQYVSALCLSIQRSVLDAPNHYIASQIFLKNIRGYLFPWLRTHDLTKLESQSIHSIVMLFNTCLAITKRVKPRVDPVTKKQSKLLENDDR